MSATAKLFTHGGSQAVRLPKEFRLPGKEVRVRREGRTVVLEPMTFDPATIQAAFEDIDGLLGDGDFLPERPVDPPVMPDPRLTFE